jgi:predicted Zn-dependent protease
MTRRAMSSAMPSRQHLRSAAPIVLAALLLALAPPPAGAQQIADPDLYGKSLRVAHEALEQYGGGEDGRSDGRDEGAGEAAGDAELARVAEIGYRVAREARYEKFPLTFHLIDMPEPNAFALPGGQLFLTRGMLEMGLDDDMLAALLGHEIAHVVLDHHGRMQRRATLMNLLGQALVIGAVVGASEDGRRDPGPYRGPEPYGSGRGELVQGAAATSLIVNELLLRSFSREHEDEADEEGQRWAAAAGFDPHGAEKLMAHMGARLPQSKKYGYWRTHPFFDERVRAGRVRGGLLKAQPPKPADEFRVRTQAALVTYLDKAEPELRPLVESEALTAWPAGAAAEGIRRDRLQRRRDAELLRPKLERDYGALVRAYRGQIAAVEALTPESALLETLRGELEALETDAAALYPEARKVLAEGVYETAFLERFLSTWPESAEAPEVALLLGDALSRLGRQTDAVGHYLRAWEAAPGSAEGERAALGLRNLASYLDRLAALEKLAAQERDEELARLARARLEQIAGVFDGIENGAEYLRRFPDGEVVEAVRARVDSLADKLYAEVVVYQALGDNTKAVERINQILTHAPLSHAAEQLRERAVLDT